MNLLTFASRDAISRFSVPVTFAWLVADGSATERGTDGIAAW